VFVDPANARWDTFASWLQRWRLANGRLIVQLELSQVKGLTISHLTESDSKLGSAARWLARAADAVAVSSPGLAALLAQLDVESTLVRHDLEPIVWRLGAAGRRLVDRRRSGGPLRIGYLGGSTSSESLAAVRQALQDLGAVAARHLVVETLRIDRRAALLGKKLYAPRFETESLMVDWAFGNLRWDIGLAPLTRDDADFAHGTDRLLEYMALGVPVVASALECSREILGPTAVGVLAGPSAKDWRDGLGALVDSPAMREGMAAEARSRLEERHAEADRERAPLDLIERAMAAPSQREVPELPDSLRGFVRGLMPHVQTGYEPSAKRATAFPGPRSSMQRKLDKLRRDPAAFFRDSKVKPLKLLKGFFD
jgi:hypothetical protein